jgi:hypothetical protein
MTNAGSQDPNLSRGEQYVRGKQRVSEERLYALKCWAIEQTDWVLGGHLTLQLFA